MTCAVCIRSITGDPHYEPLGKDDAMVAVCKACACDEVVPKENVSAGDFAISLPRDERAARIKSHRQYLAAHGICIYGEAHGKATHGQLCERCHERQRGKPSNQRRSAAKQ